MAKPELGQVYDKKYQILARLGQGGMGTVYHAHQIDANREVALKFPHIDALSEKSTIARFFREFKNLSRLSNAHIMTVYGLALDDESIPYAVCEYIEAKSLRQLIQEGPTAWPRAVRISIQICIAMESAHALGILHRDLSPENVLLLDKPEADFVKLIDFGLSRMFMELSDSQRITKSGAVLGNIHYMAPEQLSKSQVDQRCDIYSLGAVLFELLSGSYLFDSGSPIQILQMQQSENPEFRINSLPAEVPQHLLGVLSRMLDKNPENRQQSMKLLAAELESTFENAQQQAPRRRSSKSSPAGKRQALRALLLAGLIAAAASAIFIHEKKAAKQHAETAGTAGPETKPVIPSRTPSAETVRKNIARYRASWERAGRSKDESQTLLNKYRDLANAYLSENNNDGAAAALSQGIKLADDLSNVDAQIDLRRKLGSCLLKIDPQMAVDKLLETGKLAKSPKDAFLLRNETSIWHDLIDAYIRLGRPDKATEILKEQIAFRAKGSSPSLWKDMTELFDNDRDTFYPEQFLPFGNTLMETCKSDDLAPQQVKGAIDFAQNTASYMISRSSFAAAEEMLAHSRILLGKVPESDPDRAIAEKQQQRLLKLCKPAAAQGP